MKKFLLFLAVALSTFVNYGCVTVNNKTCYGEDTICRLNAMPKPATVIKYSDNRQQWGGTCTILIKDNDGMYHSLPGGLFCNYKDGDVIQ